MTILWALALAVMLAAAVWFAARSQARQTTQAQADAKAAEAKAKALENRKAIEDAIDGDTDLAARARAAGIVRPAKR